ncbi:hypothetical protein L596_026643 [Steinernema carpocapsae]|uniref:Uncharacterized protein n=1 Tax=Steinernema carpocapsae TaxID=34508 RepID=A0A4U5M243_STECR|nr:hypothetical protein L596_026643 [Steinernema carpocapsae]
MVPSTTNTSAQQRASSSVPSIIANPAIFSWISPLVSRRLEETKECLVRLWKTILFFVLSDKTVFFLINWPTL